MGGTGGDVFIDHPDTAIKNGCRLWIINWRSLISHNSVFFTHFGLWASRLEIALFSNSSDYCAIRSTPIVGAILSCQNNLWQ
jgi:hypothetical protein